MEIGVFFLGLRFQHLWPGKLWKGTGGWNGENQDVVWNLELSVSMISISSEWFSVVAFAIFPLISPFPHWKSPWPEGICAILYWCHWNSKGSVIDECFVLLWLKLCLLEATSSVFLWVVFFPGLELQWDPFLMKKITCALPIVSHFWWPFCQRQELEELHNQIVAALDKLVSAVSLGTQKRLRRAWESQRVTRWRHTHWGP